MSNRPYQSDMLRTVEGLFSEGKRRLAIQMPTGAGKTRIATQLAARSGFSRVLYVVPSQEIFNQTSAKLKAHGVRHTTLRAGETPSLGGVYCLLAMSQTLANRRKKTQLFDVWEPDVIIVDEVHKLYDQHYAVLRRWPDAALIGMTATPVRLDGKSLSVLCPILVMGPTIRSLQSAGFLVPSVTYHAPSPNVRDVRRLAGDYDAGQLQRCYFDQGVLDIVPSYWLRHARGRPTITFAPGIDASRRLVETYKQAGIRAEHVDGETSTADRQSALSRLRQGKISVLCNVGLFIEGLDIIEVSCITLCQPTASVSRYMQQVGRGLRIGPGKKNLVIIDHSGNTVTHGRVDADRDWRRGGTYIGVSQRICRSCRALTDADTPRCGACAWVEKADRTNKASRRRQRQRDSRKTPPREPPKWARPHSGLWQQLERERIAHGLPLNSTPNRLKRMIA